MICDDINWRYGCVGVYESIWSIFRKYSYLNRISKSYSKYDIFGKACHRNDIFIYYSNDYNILLLSRLIGKPGIDLKFAWFDQYVCREKMIGFNLNSISINLRYCPECMLHGYHSPIHQLPWIIICPIHKTALKDTCPKCNKNITFDSWVDPCGRNFAKGITCHCDYELWPIFKTFDWPDGWSKKDTRSIGAYLRWLRLLADSPLGGGVQNGLIAINEKNKNSDLLTELFCFLRSESPPPPSVSQFMVDSPLTRKIVFDLNFLPPESDALIDLSNSIGYRGLSKYFISYHAKNKSRLPYLYCAKKLINKISAQHRYCRFRKILLRTIYKFSMFLSESLDKEFECFCPRHYLISAISNTWIGLWENKRPDVLINMYSSGGQNFYDYIPREMVESGLVFRHESPDTIGKNTLSWHPELYRFLSHLTSCFWESAASALCENYLKFGSVNIKNRGYLSFAFIEPKLPYVVMYKTGGNKIRVAIYKRNNPIDTNQFLNINWDAHVSDAHGYFEYLNNAYSIEYHRFFTEGLSLP